MTRYQIEFVRPSYIGTYKDYVVRRTMAQCVELINKETTKTAISFKVMKVITTKTTIAEGKIHANP